MGSERPLPGRCGARAQSGGYCLHHVRPGDRCRNHGGLKRDRATGQVIDKRFKHGLYSKQLHAVDRIEYERLCNADPADAARESLVRVLILGREMEAAVRADLDAALKAGDTERAVELLGRIERTHASISKRFEGFTRATEGTAVKALTHKDAREFAEQVVRAVTRLQCPHCRELLGDLAAQDLMLSLYPAEEMAAAQQHRLGAGGGVLPRAPLGHTGGETVTVEIVDTDGDGDGGG